MTRLSPASLLPLCCLRPSSFPGVTLPSLRFGEVSTSRECLLCPFLFFRLTLAVAPFASLLPFAHCPFCAPCALVLWLFARGVRFCFAGAALVLVPLFLWPPLSLSVLLFLWAPFSPCPPSSLSLAVYCGVPRCCLPYVKTRERRGSSFSQLGLEPNHTGLTAQSLFFLEESCRVKRSDTQTSSNFSNYFKRVLKLQKRSSSFSK